MTEGLEKATEGGMVLTSTTPAALPRRYKDERSRRLSTESEFISLKKVSKGLLEFSALG